MSNLEKILFAHLTYSHHQLRLFREAVSKVLDDAPTAGLQSIIDKIAISEVGKALVAKQLNHAKKCGHAIIDFTAADYPQQLRQIADFPLVIYCRGDINRLADTKKIAIIGTRKPTYDGKKMCDIAVRYLAKWPYTIVSGLAYGIDSLAHRAALSYDCPTIAVLACPADEVTPRNHVKLAKTLIEQGGLIISETPYFEFTHGPYYVRRNRIISGLCKKVFIVEGALKSGSMTTAQHALDQNRELYAMPGSISNVVAGGTNSLIKSGAHVVIEPEDLFVASERPQAAVKSHTHPVAQLLLEQGQLRIEQMSQMMDIPIHILLSELTILECQDILKVTGNMVTLVK